MSPLFLFLVALLIGLTGFALLWNRHGWKKAVAVGISASTILAGGTMLLPVGDDVFVSSDILGYEMLDNGTVLHLWNDWDSYYFNATNGVQYTNNYDEYWTRNVFMLKYYSGGVWHDIGSTDSMEGFNKQITATTNTSFNCTIWKDYTVSGYTFRFGFRYYLEPYDQNLTVTPFIKNTDTRDFPVQLAFGWRMTDIQVDGDVQNDYIWHLTNESNPTQFSLHNSSLDMSYTNLTCWYNESGNWSWKPMPQFYLKDLGDTNNSTQELYLKWDENLNYQLRVQGDEGVYNANVTLWINVGMLNSGVRKSTDLFWYDADWISPDSVNDVNSVWKDPDDSIDGSIGTDTQGLAESIDTDDYLIYTFNDDVDITRVRMYINAFQSGTVTFWTSDDGGSSWDAPSSNTISWSSGGSTWVYSSTFTEKTHVDRLRIAWTTQNSALQFYEIEVYGVETPADTTAPTPNPPTWSSVPSATSSSSITMTLNACSDPSGGVEYWFDETTEHSGATDSSSWQSSTTYTDSDLSENTLYTYHGKAHDSLNNAGSYSSSQSEYTRANPPTAGQLDVAAYGDTWILWRLVDVDNNPDAGSTDGYFSIVTNPGGGSSGLSTSDDATYYYFNDTGLTSGETYVMKARYDNYDGTDTTYSSNVEQTTSASNSAPTLTGFDAIDEGNTGWDLDNNNFTCTFTVVDLDNDDVWVSFNFADGTSVTDPTNTSYQAQVELSSAQYTQTSLDVSWTSGTWDDNDGVVTIEAVVCDGTDTSTVYSSTFSNGIDGTTPTGTITEGLGGSLPDTISGSASDSTSGVASVDIEIHDTTASKYWDGDSWETGSSWLDCSGTTTWSYTAIDPDDWTYGNNITITLRTYDTAGNVDASADSYIFTTRYSWEDVYYCADFGCWNISEDHFDRTIEDSKLTFNDTSIEVTYAVGDNDYNGTMDFIHGSLTSQTSGEVVNYTVYPEATGNYNITLGGFDNSRQYQVKKNNVLQSSPYSDNGGELFFNFSVASGDYVSVFATSNTQSTTRTETIRRDGLDYFVWLGDNTTLSGVAENISNFDDADESISVLDDADGSWDTLMGDSGGSSVVVSTFDVIRVVLGDTAGNVDVEMTENPDYTDDYENRTFELVDVGAGYNYTGMSDGTGCTLSEATVAMSMVDYEWIGLWDDSTFEWVFHFKGTNLNSAVEIGKWDVCITHITNNRTWEQ